MLQALQQKRAGAEAQAAAWASVATEDAAFSRIVTTVAMVLSLQHAILTTGWSGKCWIGAPGQSRTAVFASNVLQEISLVARSLGITCEVPRDPQGLGPD